MTYTKEQVCDIVRRAVEEYEKGRVLFTAQAGIVRRHVALNGKDRAQLFGEDYALGFGVPLGQPREYLCRETLTIAGNENMFSGTGIRGGDREETQVVLTRSDMLRLGLDLKEYDRTGAFPDAAITLIGPAGLLPAGSCVRCAERSITLSEYSAGKLGLADGDTLSARVPGRRSLTFHQVRVRVGYYSTAFHLDADEANAAGIYEGDPVEIGYF